MSENVRSPPGGGNLMKLARRHQSLFTNFHATLIFDGISCGIGVSITDSLTGHP